MNDFISFNIIFWLLATILILLVAFEKPLIELENKIDKKREEKRK